jgi:hypothetical protein
MLKRLAASPENTLIAQQSTFPVRWDSQSQASSELRWSLAGLALEIEGKIFWGTKSRRLGDGWD